MDITRELLCLIRYKLLAKPRIKGLSCGILQKGFIQRGGGYYEKIILGSINAKTLSRLHA